jgi:ferrous-iron efflux pump FieF
MNIANPYLHSSNPLNTHHRSLKRWVTIASLSVATVLVVLKFFAYMITDSVSMLTSLMDSAFDGIASMATMISVAHATTPADEEHRFGHGKVEALTAMGQSLFIFGSAALLLFEALHRFIHPVKVGEIGVGLIVTILSLVMTGGLIVFQRYVISKTSSIAISADHLHYKGDLFMNMGVFIALTLSYLSSWTWCDPLFAGMTALFLLYSAKSISIESYGILMDRELPQEDRDKISALVTAHHAVCAIHDLRTRSTGERVFIEFHMELDGAMSLKDAHDVTEDVEKEIYEAFPKSEVIIHQEPAGLDDHRLDSAIGAIS